MMRRAFKRVIGIGLGEYRQRFRCAEPALTLSSSTRLAEGVCRGTVIARSTEVRKPFALQRHTGWCRWPESPWPPSRRPSRSCCLDTPVGAGSLGGERAPGKGSGMLGPWLNKC